MITLTEERLKDALKVAKDMAASNVPKTISAGSIEIPSSAVLLVVGMLLDELVEALVASRVDVEAGPDADITVTISD